ncbi:MAG: glycosyltransferase family 2 protein [Thermoleophilia bacterium]|nr:glycosyltransferase family 2 protein [Thermoleophilia bacterium]
MPATSPRASVIVPNWNGLSHLPGCLDSLAAQSFADFEVLVVDNGSSDGSVAWIREHHPEVRVVQRPDNGGFSRAVNAGIAAARGEYVALLNNDTAADDGWLGALVGALDEHQAYDFAASKMILFYDPERLNAAGDTFAFARLAATNRGIGQPVSRYNKPERVLGACAGAALYRRALFEEVGLFDEDFFLTAEDTDFNLRCLIAGKRCLYVPGAQVRHKLGASTGAQPEWGMGRLLVRNEAIVVAKDLPAPLFALLPFLWPYRMIRQTIPLRPSRWRLVPGLVRQAPGRLRAEVEGFRLGMRKRPEVWRLKKVGTLEIVRWLVRGSGPR